MDVDDTHVQFFAEANAVTHLLQTSLYPLEIYLVDSKKAPDSHLRDKLCSWSDQQSIYLGVPAWATLPDVLHALHTMELLLADWPDPEDVTDDACRAWIRSLLLGAIAGQRVVQMDDEDTIGLTHEFFAHLLQQMRHADDKSVREFAVRAWAIIYMLPAIEHEAAMRHVERASSLVAADCAYLLKNLGDLDSEPLLGHLVEAQLLNYLETGKLSSNG